MDYSATTHRLLRKKQGAGAPSGVLRGQFMLLTRNPFADAKWNLPKALPDRFFMATLDALWAQDRAEAERIIGEYTAAGFNHVTVGSIYGPGYHGHYPFTDWRSNAEGFAEYLRWLAGKGVAYTLMLLPDCDPYFYGTGHGWDIDAVRRDFGPVYTHPTVHALTRRTCTAWEQYAPIAEMAKAFDLQREWFPNAERFWHNNPGHLSPGNSDENEEECWRSAARHGITGMLLQAAPEGDGQFNNPDGTNHVGYTAIDSMRYDLWDMGRRFGLNNDKGPKGESAGNPWGHAVTQPDGTPLTLDYFEGTAFAMYWHGHGNDLADAWGKAASGVEGVRFCLDGAA